MAVAVIITSSVPALKSWESESKDRKYMLFDGLLPLLLVTSQAALERMGDYSLSLNFGQTPVIAEGHL